MRQVPGLAVETIAPRAVRVRLERPPVNALSSELYAGLTDVLGDLADRGEISCILLGSALDDPFCAGADLKEIAAAGDDPRHGQQRAQLARRLFQTVLELPVPTVAVVTGQALGAGCVLATLCDLRVAAPPASFRLPEIDVGLLGGFRHVARLLPQGAARYMSLTGRGLSAEDAHRLGMVEFVAEDSATAWAMAEDIAADIAAKDPTAIRLAKRAIVDSEELSLDSGYRVEQSYTAQLRGGAGVALSRSWKDRRGG
ncbi:MAG: enoyl-CoA hydratase/isomerase family protein [Actinomycetota bacterium]